MNTADEHDEEMREEYDLSGGVRGKFYRNYLEGHTVRIHRIDGQVEEHHFTPKDGAVTLDPDLREHFPTSESVNEALRSLVMQDSPENSA